MDGKSSGEFWYGTSAMPSNLPMDFDKVFPEGKNYMSDNYCTIIKEPGAIWKTRTPLKRPFLENGRYVWHAVDLQKDPNTFILPYLAFRDGYFWPQHNWKTPKPDININTMLPYLCQFQLFNDHPQIKQFFEFSPFSYFGSSPPDEHNASQYIPLIFGHLYLQYVEGMAYLPESQHDNWEKTFVSYFKSSKTETMDVNLPSK